MLVHADLPVLLVDKAPQALSPQPTPHSPLLSPPSPLSPCAGTWCAPSPSPTPSSHPCFSYAAVDVWCAFTLPYNIPERSPHHLCPSPGFKASPPSPPPPFPSLLTSPIRSHAAHNTRPSTLQKPFGKHLTYRVGNARNKIRPDVMIIEMANTEQHTYLPCDTDRGSRLPNLPATMPNGRARRVTIVEAAAVTPRIWRRSGKKGNNMPSWGRHQY